MKVHLVTLSIVDFDGLGADAVGETIEHTRYPNYCISPSVVSIRTADIGAWRDDHPLNLGSTAKAEIARLFVEPPNAK